MTEIEFKHCELCGLELSSALQNEGRAFCDPCRLKASHNGQPSIVEIFKGAGEKPG